MPPKRNPDADNDVSFLGKNKQDDELEIIQKRLETDLSIDPDLAETAEFKQISKLLDMLEQRTNENVVLRSKLVRFSLKQKLWEAKRTELDKKMKDLEENLKNSQTAQMLKQQHIQMLQE